MIYFVRVGGISRIPTFFVRTPILIHTLSSNLVNATTKAPKTGSRLYSTIMQPDKIFILIATYVVDLRTPEVKAPRANKLRFSTYPYIEHITSGILCTECIYTVYKCLRCLAMTPPAVYLHHKRYLRMLVYDILTL